MSYTVFAVVAALVLLWHSSVAVDDRKNSLGNRKSSVLGCIHYVSYRGGQRILGGDLKFLEQKKGGYENCLNISGGMLIFCKILSSFCNGFKR